ncbi:hypothetical protein GEV33_008625 [Tenebrio molitor]|uniref:Uncharacterized protein n=1 Tax=Tenebrio molitor TaxID=7067 RepID=A0A8J6HHD8_TENMO|nr:hypothetical protein GEV33_008625 [Tenebrio molitor]
MELAETAPWGLCCFSKDQNINKHLDQYRNALNNTIKNESGSCSKDIIMKTLMDFAAEPSNIEELADTIGDIATNVVNLDALNFTIGALLQAKQFEDFVKNLLGLYVENVGKYRDDREKFSSDRLIWEISQTVADYVTDLTVDFIRDRIMSEESEWLCVHLHPRRFACLSLSPQSTNQTLCCNGITFKSPEPFVRIWGPRSSRNESSEGPGASCGRRCPLAAPVACQDNVELSFVQDRVWRKPPPEHLSLAPPARLDQNKNKTNERHFSAAAVEATFKAEDVPKRCQLKSRSDRRKRQLLQIFALLERQEKVIVSAIGILERCQKLWFLLVRVQWRTTLIEPSNWGV